MVSLTHPFGHRASVVVNANLSVNCPMQNGGPEETLAGNPILQPGLESNQRGLGPIRNAKFVEDVPGVRFDSIVAYKEFIGDLLIIVSPCNQAENCPLAVRQG